MSKYYPANKEGTNEATEDITKLILSPDTKVCIKRTIKRKQKSKIIHKPGYDNDCFVLKRNLNHLGKLLHKYPNDPWIKSSFLNNKKRYKKLVKSKQKQYKEVIMYQVEMLESTNPKEYWKLVHKLQNIDKDASKQNIEPDISALIKHYENIYGNNDCNYANLEEI